MVLMLMPLSKMMGQSFQYPEYEEDTVRIAVNYTGKQPDIADFVTAVLDASNEIDFYQVVNRDWKLYRKNQPIVGNATITLDVKNGYMRYETHYPEASDLSSLEMCYWNCKDGKHKLICCNGVLKMEDDYGWADYVGPSFYLYDTATKSMRDILAEDIGALYDGNALSVFFLPRKGKDIKVTISGDGELWKEVLVWDGFQFHSKEVK